MDLNQVITIIAEIAAISISISGFLYFFINRFDGDIKQLTESIQALGNRMDAQGARLDAQGARLDAQGARTDRLYQMFVDLLREQKHK